MDTFTPEHVWKQTLALDDGCGRKAAMPQVGFGCYHIETEEPIFDAIKYGYRNIDSAAYYENEKFVGRQVRRAYAELGLTRSDLFISTKVFNDMMGYEKTKKAVEIALANLDLEYIDLMFLHFPATEGLEKNDPKHVENRHGSWKALEELVEAGSLKFIGISNFVPHHIEDLLKVAKIKPVVNQFEIHPMYVEHETIECCRKHGIVVQAYSPFAQFNKTLIEHPTLQRISKERNLDIARVILLWLLRNFAVLAKSATASRIASNIQLAGLDPLTEADVAAINELSKCPPITICWKAHEYP
jgi:methylglyoxal/glyoxal reductase